ncbi:hypothetical protein C4D60_Mb07t10380 [Musa balbisiana]|uniref:Uncharacterized protein n=1 Tax=Musa balbisiana TaxID=52838 RepID=A0A4S8JEA8_MUSBA|nr:hypothetical protein C4D60_Mb07t10380 [Musa balbisiana]
MPFPESFEPTIPFVATLCFFKKAAEKPEAQTYTKQRLELLSHWILRIRNDQTNPLPEDRVQQQELNPRHIP